jgi:hypothetical protein
VTITVTPKQRGGTVAVGFAGRTAAADSGRVRILTVEEEEDK